MVRAAIPPFLVLAPLWLLAASLYVHLEMTAPIYIWAILMSMALNKVWRHHRLAHHNLDPNLVDQIGRKKNVQFPPQHPHRCGRQITEVRSNRDPIPTVRASVAAYASNRGLTRRSSHSVSTFSQAKSRALSMFHELIR